jgi:hypothetical protein
MFFQFCVPVILSEAGQTYHDWLANWGCHLMQKIKDPKVQLYFFQQNQSNNVPTLAVYNLCNESF